MFTFIFYSFSLYLSYTDIKKFRVPNQVVFIMASLLVISGFIENKIDIYSFILPALILAFFVVILLLMPKMILGGGDIKFIMVIGLYLGYTIFPIFLIVSGLLQSSVLYYLQHLKEKKRRVAPMVPIMVLSVLISEAITFFGFNPLVH